jgi:gamma-glutamyltranspeptidase
VKPDGTLLREGDFVRNLKLGRTLRLIAENPQSFYDGPLAQEIVDDIAEYGGNITRTDLTNYAAVVKPPLKVTLRNGGYTLYNPPPPSSGAVIDFIMSVLDGL